MDHLFHLRIDFRLGRQGHLVDRVDVDLDLLLRQEPDGLLQNANTLAHFLDADHVAGETIALGAGRNVEIKPLVAEVRLVAPQVAAHAAGPGVGSGDAVADDLFGGDPADALGPRLPDRVATEDILDLLQLARRAVGHIADPLLEVRRHVPHQPARAGVAGHVASPGDELEEVVTFLAADKAPQKRRHAAQVQGGRAQKKAVVLQPGHLGQYQPHQLRVLGALDPVKFLDRHVVGQAVGERRQVVHAVGHGDVLVVGAVLAEFLEARVQVADVGRAPRDPLALQFQQQPEGAVRGRVLRTEVQDHPLAADRPGRTSFANRP